jgi:hypothetical protein
MRLSLDFGRRMLSLDHVQERNAHWQSLGYARIARTHILDSEARWTCLVFALLFEWRRDREGIGSLVTLVMHRSRTHRA